MTSLKSLMAKGSMQMLDTKAMKNLKGGVGVSVSVGDTVVNVSGSNGNGNGGGWGPED